jgi:hypothetical protein
MWDGLHDEKVIPVARPAFRRLFTHVKVDVKGGSKVVGGSTQPSILERTSLAGSDPLNLQLNRTDANGTESSR